MRVAIIGGGFSGTSLSAHLMFQDINPLTLYLCEKNNPIGQGIAYSTPFPWLLLNVPAERMGALDYEPEGFYNWLLHNEMIWREADPAFKDISFSKNAFLPRKLYGLYLSNLIQSIESSASKHGNTFETIQGDIVDMKQTSKNDLKIIFRNRHPLEVDKIVLATGVQVIKHLPFAKISDRYIANLWNWDQKHLIDLISNTNSDSVIFVIGTGLTTVDLLTLLDRIGYKGKIIVLSRHGKFPALHHIQQLPSLKNLEKILSATKLVDMYRLFNKELSKLEAAEGNWRQLMDELRPISTTLWQQLSLKDKMRFFRHLLPLWNRHRHRLPPAGSEIIDRLFQQKRLKIITGKAVDIKENGKVEIHYKQDRVIKTLNADLVFNCTGPEYRLRKHPEELFENLIKRGWIIPDELGLGIKANANFEAEGPLSQKIYVMGALLFGNRFETVSVPELRNQAQAIASELLAVEKRL